MQGISQLLPLLLIFVVMYFFMIRPQIKRQKNEKKFFGEIKKGDRIVTKSGLHAKVLDFGDDGEALILDIGAGKVKFERSAISMEMTQKVNKPVTEKA
ncbi:MAG: preprotein translocase subunit YajC [Flavobacteriaceae bacterium]|nr:preprotein translocase subunit YajC [Flavobacteriaceae bacterium]MDZ4148720.1 preprotein translocase subunit YajC [Flavobacteriaceae bacterium]